MQRLVCPYAKYWFLFLCLFNPHDMPKLKLDLLRVISIQITSDWFYSVMSWLTDAGHEYFRLHYILFFSSSRRRRHPSRSIELRQTTLAGGNERRTYLKHALKMTSQTEPTPQERRKRWIFLSFSVLKSAQKVKATGGCRNRTWSASTAQLWRWVEGCCWLP